MNYVIVRTIRSIVIDDQADTVACVYGPFDEQGCSAAYKKLVAAGLADGAARLHIRGLYATGDSPVADPWTFRPSGSFTETVTREASA
jgi:hypothetical protein